MTRDVFPIFKWTRAPASVCPRMTIIRWVATPPIMPFASAGIVTVVGAVAVRADSANVAAPPASRESASRDSSDSSDGFRFLCRFARARPPSERIMDEHLVLGTCLDLGQPSPQRATESRGKDTGIMNCGSRSSLNVVDEE
ncbi:MAG: hypothetical protein ACXWNR_05870, partial [Candidatus Limnocylindrales bacterium]